MSNNAELIASTIEAAAALILVQADFVCIHARPIDAYCDECPLSGLLATDHFTYKQSKIICTKKRSYSK